PRISDSIQLEDGTYHYFGLTESLKKEVESGLLSGGTHMSLIINIDGLPLSRSSANQFWPILVLVHESKMRVLFTAALYFGKSKPKCLEGFLSDFINELLHLITGGLLHGSITYSVSIRAFVCDAPARSYAKCITGHAGYYSCEKCSQKGTYSLEFRKVLLTEVDHARRTDNDFKQQKNKQHHKGESPLLKLPIGMVSQFPLDYMHLVCLGVIKKILVQYWLGKTPSSAKLPSHVKASISQ
ncbi:unnamed protein product, partial [Ixodes persulcatus]